MDVETEQVTCGARNRAQVPLNLLSLVASSYWRFKLWYTQWLWLSDLLLVSSNCLLVQRKCLAPSDFWFPPMFITSRQMLVFLYFSLKMVIFHLAIYRSLGRNSHSDFSILKLVTSNFIWMSKVPQMQYFLKKLSRNNHWMYHISPTSNKSL